MAGSYWTGEPYNGKHVLHVPLTSTALGVFFRYLVLKYYCIPCAGMWCWGSVAVANSCSPTAVSWMILPLTPLTPCTGGPSSSTHHCSMSAPPTSAVSSFTSSNLPSSPHSCVSFCLQVHSERLFRGEAVPAELHLLVCQTPSPIHTVVVGCK